MQAARGASLTHSDAGPSGRADRRRRSRTVFVLVALAAYSVDVLSKVWAVERRENLLEDHSVLNRAKDGRATNKQLFDYYLGWVSDPSVTNHFDLIPDAQVGFARATRRPSHARRNPPPARSSRPSPAR